MRRTTVHLIGDAEFKSVGILKAALLALAEPDDLTSKLLTARTAVCPNGRQLGIYTELTAAGRLCSLSPRRYRSENGLSQQRTGDRRHF